MNQLGPDSLTSLRKLAETYQSKNAGGLAGAGSVPDATDKEDDVPELVEGNFEEVAEEK